MAQPGDKGSIIRDLVICSGVAAGVTCLFGFGMYRVMAVEKKKYNMPRTACEKPSAACEKPSVDGVKTVRGTQPAADGFPQAIRRTLPPADGFPQSVHGTPPPADGFPQAADGFPQAADGFSQSVHGTPPAADGESDESSSAEDVVDSEYFAEHESAREPGSESDEDGWLEL